MAPADYHSSIEKGTLNQATAPTTPTKGLPETAPSQRPLRDAATDACFLEYKSRSSGWSFREKQYLTLARRSKCLLAVKRRRLSFHAFSIRSRIKQPPSGWPGDIFPMYSDPAGLQAVRARQRDSGRWAWVARRPVTAIDPAATSSPAKRARRAAAIRFGSPPSSHRSQRTAGRRGGKSSGSPCRDHREARNGFRFSRGAIGGIGGGGCE